MRSDDVYHEEKSGAPNAGVHQRRLIIAPAAVWCNALGGDHATSISQRLSALIVSASFNMSVD